MTPAEAVYAEYLRLYQEMRWITDLARRLDECQRLLDQTRRELAACRAQRDTAAPDNPPAGSPTTRTDTDAG